MIIFDSLRKLNPIGTGFILENKKIRFMQISNFSNQVSLKVGEHQIKLSGKRNSGNGSFDILIFGKDEKIISQRTNFPSGNTTTVVFNFNIKKEDIYSFKIVRGKESIGTIIFESIRILYTQNLINEITKKQENKFIKETKLFIKEDLDVSQNFIFIIDDISSDGSDLDYFITSKNLSLKECKILNLYSDIFYEKKYSNKIDKRVFLSIDDMIEFINISEPEIVVILSKNKELIDIKNKIEINCIISGEKTKERPYDKNIDKAEKSMVVLNFEGIFV